MAVRRSYAAFVLLLLLSGVIPAQPVATYDLSILLSVREEEGDTGLLENVIADSLALEFLLNDFKVLFGEGSDREGLLLEAGEKRAPYLLEGRYRIHEDRLSLRLDCLRTDGNNSLYSDEKEFPVDLNLDNAIQEQVRELIVLIQRDAENNPPYGTAGGGEEKEEPAEDADIPLEETSSEKEEPSPGPAERKLVVFGDFGLFIPLGKSRDYFDIGYVPAVSAVYSIPLPFGVLEPGACLSVNIINAQGSYNSSSNLFLLMAPQIRYRIPLGDLFSVYIRLAAGGNFLMINRNGEGYQGILVPCFQTGVGGAYAFRDRFGFQLGADLSMSFEESLTITGIQPFLGVYYRL